MNFKPHLLEKVLAGEKTQTRRPIKGVDMAIDIDGNPGAVDSQWFGMLEPIKTVIDEKGRTRYEVGKVYAVCPGRGKSGQGFIRLTHIRYEDVRCITREDVIAEGFKDHFEFFDVWCGFYDPRILKSRNLAWDAGFTFDLQSALHTQPLKLYQAWALTFELLTWNYRCEAGHITSVIVTYDLLNSFQNVIAPCATCGKAAPMTSDKL